MSGYLYCLSDNTLYDGFNPSRCCFELKSNWDDEDTDYIIQDCAEDFWNNRDGLEYTWPLSFSVFSKSGELLFSGEVIMELEPQFFCGEIKTKDQP